MTTPNAMVEKRIVASPISVNNPLHANKLASPSELNRISVKLPTASCKGVSGVLTPDLAVVGCFLKSSKSISIPLKKIKTVTPNDESSVSVGVVEI